MSVRHCLLVAAALAACAPPAHEDLVTQASDGTRCAWTQWGRDAAHAGAGCADGQALATERAHADMDSFVDQEVADVGFGDDGPLLIHYQVPRSACGAVWTAPHAVVPPMLVPQPRG